MTAPGMNRHVDGARLAILERFGDSDVADLCAEIRRLQVIERLAATVVDRAPNRQAKHTTSALIPWHLIHDLRAAIYT